MKNNSIVINTARGGLVDEVALIRCLKAGKIAAAGLDVYDQEPVLNKNLIELENVVLLPHLGSATIESRVAMGMRVLDNIRKFFNGNSNLDKVI